MNQSRRSLIVIPTYNEADNLTPLVNDIRDLDCWFDILVVDDNSPDGTGQIADALSSQRPGIHVLHREGKLGLGTAYVAGFRWALERRYDYVLEMDCDFSHHPRYLPRFLEEIERADMVIGSRYIEGGGTANWGLVRQIISRGGNAFARTMLGLKTRDCTSGYRCYRGSTLQMVPWEALQLEGYGFQVGAVFHVERLGGKVAEFPIIFEDRRVGQSKMSLGIVLEALLFVARTAIGRPRAGSRQERRRPDVV
jgi:dolichol-phosphate mannosyltransferase